MIGWADGPPGPAEHLAQRAAGGLGVRPKAALGPTCHVSPICLTDRAAFSVRFRVAPQHGTERVAGRSMRPGER